MWRARATLSTACPVAGFRHVTHESKMNSQTDEQLQMEVAVELGCFQSPRAAPGRHGAALF
jgi:hypothetical protein